jgi:hypothetical protein
MRVQDYNFACGSVWKLVSDIMGRTKSEGVENIWIEERTEKSA